MIPIKFIQDQIERYYYIASNATPKTAEDYMRKARELKGLLDNWKLFGKQWERKQNDAVTERHYSQASMRLIREQKEIRAIPVEWIEKKAKELVMGKGEHFYSLLDLPIIYELIEAWRKEQDMG